MAQLFESCKCSTCLRPRGISRVKRATEIGESQPLDRRNSFRVLVSGLHRIVSRYAAEHVLATGQRQQALWSWTENIGISMIAGTPRSELWLVVFVAHHDERWYGHLIEAGGAKTGIVSDSRTEMIAASTSGGEQHTRFDPGIGKMHNRSIIISKLCTQQHACCMPAE